MGLAQQEVFDEIISQNIEQEISATKNLEPGFKMINGKIGLTCAMDGGWQKRGTGTSYNSRTGHNFAIGGYTNKIIS